MERYEPHKFEEYFKEVLHDYQGHSVYDTEHSVARYHERVGKDIFLYTKLLKKGINWIINNKKEFVEDRYIFVSKKYGFGIQVHWRPDRNNSKQFDGYSATTLSEEEMEFFTKKDKQLFLEQLYFEESKEKALKTIQGYYRYAFTEELQKEMDLCGFDLFIEKGEIYHTFELIEV